MQTRCKRRSLSGSSLGLTKCHEFHYSIHKSIIISYQYVSILYRNYYSFRRPRSMAATNYGLIGRLVARIGFEPSTHDHPALNAVDYRAQGRRGDKRHRHETGRPKWWAYSGLTATAYWLWDYIYLFNYRIGGSFIIILLSVFT